MKPTSIHCRPGTTEAMERLAAENEALRAELESTANLAIKQGEWLQAIVNITKGEPGEPKQYSTHDVVESVEALRVERDGALARVERLIIAIEPFATGGPVDCIGRGDYSVMHERLKDWTGVSEWKLVALVYNETPAQSLSHIKAAGAREALQRAMKPNFSDTVVRVDCLEAVIADMEK